ncbi:MAG: hypothetical protein ACYC5O_22060 [Anaerolineae bacterium]
MAEVTDGDCRCGSGAERYEITVEGHLDRRWSSWFSPLAVTVAADGRTILAGPVMDQAALHGLLARIRDLNLTLVSVRRCEPDAADGH